MKIILLFFSLLSVMGFSVLASAKEFDGHCSLYENGFESGVTRKVSLVFFDRSRFGWALGQDIGPFRLDVYTGTSWHPDGFGRKGDKLTIALRANNSLEQVIRVPTKAFVDGDFVSIFRESQKIAIECVIGIK